VKAEYIPAPMVKDDGNIDASNFSIYPESDGQAPGIPTHLDPFIDW